MGDLLDKIMGAFITIFVVGIISLLAVMVYDLAYRKPDVLQRAVRGEREAVLLWCHRYSEHNGLDQCLRSFNYTIMEQPE